MQPRTIITLQDLAEEIGAKVPQLRYLIQTGRIPGGERIGRSLTYTPDEAEQIREWWESRKRLVFTPKNNRR